MRVLWCAECEAETLFEVPPCEDGHGQDCLDLACVQCGLGVVLGVLPQRPAPVAPAAAA